MSKGALRAKLRRFRRELGEAGREVARVEEMERELRKLKLRGVDALLDRYMNKLSK